MPKFRLIATGYISILFVVFLFVFVKADQSAPYDTMIASSVAVAITPTNTPTLQPTATPTPTPAAQPVRLIIPRLQIDTSIESKGEDAAGHMDVPARWNNVAWYNLGPKPGEAGSAVVAGHYDTSTGTPAVFYHLSSLGAGDTIYVVDETNNTLTFRVTSVRNYNYYLFPVDEVFNDLSGRKLNLITCSGVWDFIQNNYSDRLVVFSELQ